MKKTILLSLIFITFLSMNSFSQDTTAAKKQTIVLISTDFGNIKAILYNETPQHRDNFIKMVKSGWYDGSIFHRVIKNFMIQGGMSGKGKEDPGYTIKAEIKPQFFHKRGALCAARTNNPQKASSGSQFYIVHGRTFNDAQLDNMYTQTGHQWTSEQREVYKKLGGAPHLDGDYTVFGEVIEGMDVVDKIASVEVGAGSKPLKDIKMNITIVDK